MGTYVNPESESMRLAINSPIYVDKELLQNNLVICLG